MSTVHAKLTGYRRVHKVTIPYLVQANYKRDTQQDLEYEYQKADDAGEAVERHVLDRDVVNAVLDHAVLLGDVHAGYDEH